MSLRLDIHLHTSRYSGDSQLAPEKLIEKAVATGLDGVVITEHHHIWDPNELAELVEAGPAPGFILLSGFEYTSSAGDILIYGLEPDRCKEFEPWKLTPGEAVDKAHELGAACVAAHPTRLGLGFDEKIFNLPLDGIEVASCNLTDNEQRLASKLAVDLGILAVAGSDAHELKNTGKYATEFSGPVSNLAQLTDSLKQGMLKVYSV